MKGDTAIEANRNGEALPRRLGDAPQSRTAPPSAPSVNDDTTACRRCRSTTPRRPKQRGGAGTHHLHALSLSAAATGPGYRALRDGQRHGAWPGTDYVAQSSSAHLRGRRNAEDHPESPAIGDAVVEANEGFSVVPTSPTGATIADATGLGHDRQRRTWRHRRSRRSASPTPR